MIERVNKRYKFLGRRLIILKLHSLKGENMKLIVLAIFTAIISTVALAADTPPIFEKPDPKASSRTHSFT